MKSIIQATLHTLTASILFSNTTLANTTPRGAILDRNNQPLAHTIDGKRTYPSAKTAAHITGYTSKGTGKTNLELTLEKTLAAGKNTSITIDSSLQKTCYDLLAAQGHPGAIVIQDPNTGAILALASYPSFDPNLLTPNLTQENWEKLNGDKLHPLLNRATHPATPGAIMTPLTALAGEHAGLNNPEIHCKGFTRFGKIKIHDWQRNRNEKLRIPSAIETSCGTYFLELSGLMTPEPMLATAKLLHLDKPTLASLPTQKSSWPTMPRNKPETPTRLAISAIGQGNDRVTPLDAAAMTSAIATGVWQQPHLLTDRKKPHLPSQLVGQGSITQNSLHHIRTGMHLCIHSKRGTASRAAIDGHKLAGVTGTAQTTAHGKLSHNSWFTGYAPYQKPQYTVTVFLSGANSGAKFAAPIAAKLFKVLLEKKPVQ